MNNLPEPNIFKAYDIRGVVDKTLTIECVEKIGRALGSYASKKKQRKICVGYDGRLSSPKLSNALITGLLSTGIDVINIGLVTTPMLYFSTHFLQTHSGVMITGSHNPPEYNGLKMMVDGVTLSPDEIQYLYQSILDKEFITGEGELCYQDIKNNYLKKIKEIIRLERPMTISIDCGNGAAGVCAEELFSSLGVKVNSLFCDVDGNFPNHHPDPSNPKNLTDLQKILKTTNSELGLAFDGDGDRLGVITKSGEIIYPDRQLLLFAEDVLINNPGTTIIFDVKSTRHLFKWIKDKGGIPMIWKTGHSLIKAKMKEESALLAGEMSGHTFFSDRWYGFDDGLYAGARLLEILSKYDNPSEVLEALPKGFSTPEINISLNEGEQHKLIEKLQIEAKFENAIEIIMIDGLRVEYKNGFGLMRASNTTPVIVLRFEADTADMLEKIKNDFKKNLSKYLPINKITF
jgi:phosphomannomutase / phosphoglucomutase